MKTASKAIHRDDVSHGNDCGIPEYSSHFTIDAASARAYWRKVFTTFEKDQTEAVYLVLKDLKPNLLKEDFDHCNKLIDVLDINNAPLVILTTILAITKPWKLNITRRQEVIDVAVEKAHDEYNNEDVARLIDPKR